MKIFKYPLEIRDRIVIQMPIGAVLLHVDVQREMPCLWAAVDPEEADEGRVIYVRGTGHELGRVAVSKYVGTFQMLDGELVWHVFDGGSAEVPF